MYLTGFADEASQDFDQQIAVTKELGWSHIESRSIGGVNIHDLPSDDFKSIVKKCKDSGVQINCFGSTIANWAKDIRDDFSITIEEVERAIPRMHELGTKMIRIMSYAKIADQDDQLKEERFRRLREITDRFLQSDIQPVHENCMNYGGMSYLHSLEIVERVPGLKLIFDTGNPAFNKDWSKPGNTYQNAYEFFSHTADHTAYIHIKDCYMNDQNECIYTYPGEGANSIPAILKSLKGRDYDGGISIEPHLASVFHDADTQNKTSEDSYAIYKKYGLMLMEMLNQLNWKHG
jgi:sugar phosphate isomerase/epimerase